MICRAKDIYGKMKNGPIINSEKEFQELLDADDSPITEDMLTEALSELRLALGQNFKLDRICFLLGNGCSI